MLERFARILIITAMVAPAAFAIDAPQPLEPLPSPRQLAWHNDELTMFIHFGMNTFTGLGTGKGDEDEKLFNPTQLDCKQWVRVAKENGFKGMILTAKHHDGFCLWPTKTTQHSVAKSEWKSGQGDVVREFTDACKEAGMKAGIYCSPWDRSVSFYDSDRPKYAEMYRAQLTELLSNYGPVYEMWFDGNKANVADWPNVIKVVRSLQPDAIIKQGPIVKPIEEDVRWVGNEQACALNANWCVYPPPDQPEEGGQARIWFPVECDTIMNGHWFWDENPPKDLPTLLNYYYTSVGRGSILMLNVAPDKRGQFSDAAVARLKEFRSALDQIFGTDLAAGKTRQTSDDGKVIEIDLGGEQEFNVVRSEEAIELGQRVSDYTIEVFSGGSWKQVQHGKTIGHKKLDRFPKIHASKVRLTVVSARATPVIKSLGVHLDTVSPPEYFEPDKANMEIVRKPRATTAPAQRNQ
jgi:alpha-L-fucosidase